MSAHSAEFSPTQISMAHSHSREISVASFASSLYLPVDPDNQPSLDDDADTYPSSDELFGPDHEEGDDYTISSRRYLSSHSRYSSAFSHVSHPPTPPRSTRSTMSLERPSSSLSLTPPPARHSNMDSSCSPSAWTNRPAAIRTMASTAELPSPPSTAHSSNDAHMSVSLDKHVADQGVPIEKFDQLALEHLEQDKALLQVLRKLDDQKLRIAQLTYALSRLRVLSNSACLSAADSGAPIAAGSSSVIQPRRLGVVIPKPLIVRQSSKSATSTIGRSTLLSAGTNSTGLSGPSQNEAVNQRRLAKQQLHEFALRRRPTRSAPKGRANNKPTPDVAKRRGWEWEGARGSPSMVAKETKPRTADAVGHPNVTVRRPKRPDPPAHQAKSPARPPRPSITPTASPATPPRLLSLFSSPISITSRSPRTPTQTQLSAPAFHDSPTTPVPSRRNKNKPLPTRPVSPTKPMRLARNMSLRYEIPPVPPPEQITAYVTMVDRRTPPLPIDEVKHRLEATFAHFSHKGQPQVPSPLDAEQARTPGPYELDPRQRAEPDYLEQMLHQKWVAQLDEHSHQARGSWRSPLKLMRQKIAGGLGIGAVRKSSRASIGDSSSEAHTSLDTPGYVHGLGTVQEGGVDSEHEGTGGGWLAIDKTKKLKKKSGKEEGAGTPKSSKSAWRFSRLASSSS